MIYKKSITLFLLTLFLSSATDAASLLRIVGSSAVFPFAATVAEHLKYKSQMAAPLVEAVGTGAGINLFCRDPNGPDGAITSRSMTRDEKNKCHQNGIFYVE